MKPNNKNIELQYYIFEEKESDTDYSKTRLSDSIVKLSPFKKTGIHIEDPTHYGKTAGLYYVWKNSTADYIGFSLDEKLPSVDMTYISEKASKGIGIIMLEASKGNTDIREKYRTMYYDHDINVVTELIKRDYSYMSECLEEVLKKNELFYPVAIMRKDIYRKFCMWLFSILEDAISYCADKTSIYQNRYAEHLTAYLLTIYIKYNEDKLRIDYLPGYITFHVPGDKYELTEEGSLIERAQKAIDDGHPEAIEGLLAESDNDNDDADAKTDEVRRAYNDYIREKRYFKRTWMDICPDISKHIIEKNKNAKTVPMGRKPKVLMLKWNSFNGEDYIKGFERLGFETDYIITPSIDFLRLEDKTAHFNNYLDTHSYDMVFSINYFHAMSEACYVHGIPYMAWCYDSPTDLFPLMGLKYDTSNVFLFDSNEAYYYNEISGFKNVHYLPLAVDSNRYDSIVLTPEEKEKYAADVSFVGGLYDNRLSEYLNYFEDYKKGFINAMIDYNVGLYNSYVINLVMDGRIREWLKDKTFHNAFYKGESSMETDPMKDDDPGVMMGRFIVLLNKTVANRERLLLISMLGKHFDFKLYSSSTHEIFKQVTECGTVDYYTEMPKVFKGSKINLNNTLKTIKTGIPLRCLDIMGCGGFLLTNYQADFDEHFTDGENIAIYHSLEEAYDKCKYYLEHEDERLRVAANGYATIKKHYSFETLIRKMLEVSDVSYLLENQ